MNCIINNNKILIADTFWKRFKGLMNRNKKDDEVMLLFNCSRVHTFFMKFIICVIYLDENFHIIEHEIIAPWHIGKKVKGARHVIEISNIDGIHLPVHGKLVLKLEEVIK